LLTASLFGFTTLTAAYFLVSAILLSRRSHVAAREIIAGAATRHTESGVTFVIILPMLREQRVVREAISYFAGIARTRRDLHLIVAVSARERQDWEGRRQTGPSMAAPHATTGMLADEAAKTINAELSREVVSVVEAPAERIGKVGQLNTAVEWWCAQTPQGTSGNIYFVLYDADSRPDPKVFDCASEIIRRRGANPINAPVVLQQISCYCRNLWNLQGWRGLLSIADAIAQTRWALGFEYGVYRDYSRAVMRGGLRPLIYCVGHGCFVHASFLNRIGGFPTVSATDDLALGYLISTLGADAVPLPTLDYCDVAPDPLASVRQSRFWYYGSARFAENISYFCKRFDQRLPLLQRLVFAIHGHGRRIAWAWRPTAAILALVIAVAANWTIMLTVLLLAHVLYVQFGFFETIAQLRRIPGAREAVGLERTPMLRIAMAGAIASLTFVLRSLGPLSVSAGLVSSNAIGWKTER
jgi:hypothetical protein